MRRWLANRLLVALVFCALALFVGLPVESAAHADDHAHAPAGLHDADSHADETLSDHCHPGLDCFTAAIFILPVETTPNAFLTTAEYPTRFHMVDDVRPDMDLPPPRPQS